MNNKSPAALAHFRLLPADQQAQAIRRLLLAQWPVDAVARNCGMSVDDVVHLLAAFPEAQPAKCERTGIDERYCTCSLHPRNAA